MKSIIYAGKIYKADDENLPEEAKKRLGIKPPRPAKAEKPTKKVEKKEDK